MKDGKPRSAAEVEIVPVPEGFMFPAGTKVVSNSGTGEASGGSSRKVGTKSSLLKPIADTRFDDPYYLVFMRDVDGVSDVRPYFAGRGQRWLDSKVLKFMLEDRGDDPSRFDHICIPLSERGVRPSLRRIVQLSSECNAVPVFLGRLPQLDDVFIELSTELEVPTRADVSADARKVWDRLLTTLNSEGSRSCLSRFKDAMNALLRDDPADRVRVTAYVFRIETEMGEVRHPGAVVMKESIEGRRR